MKNNLIGISGKIGSGKDTIGRIIQYLTLNSNVYSKTNSDIIADLENDWYVASNKSTWKIKKFADKLKDIVCLLIGCTREQLEDREFKERELGEEWWKYVIKKGQKTFVIGLYAKYFSTKEEADFFRRGELSKYTLDYNADDFHVDIEKLTPRKILQLLGTECGREIIHPNIWVNALFADYKKETKSSRLFHKLELMSEEGDDIVFTEKYPNWIITDVRFPNEVKAIKDRGGVVIRINRLQYTNLLTNAEMIQCLEQIGYIYPELAQWKEDAYSEGFRCIEDVGLWYHTSEDKPEHESETALDNYKDFDYIINNNGTVLDLISKVKKLDL